MDFLPAECHTTSHRDPGHSHMNLPRPQAWQHATILLNDPQRLPRMPTACITIPSLMSPTLCFRLLPYVLFLNCMLVSCNVPRFVSACPPQQPLALYQPCWLLILDSWFCDISRAYLMNNTSVIPLLLYLSFRLLFSHVYASDSDSCTFL